MSSSQFQIDDQLLVEAQTKQQQANDLAGKLTNAGRVQQWLTSHPEVVLAVAAGTGVLLGWWIKRR